MNRHFMCLLVTTNLLLALIFNTAHAFSCADTATTGIPQLECEALVALYDSTDGDNWCDNTGWKTAKPVKGWYGIQHWFDTKQLGVVNGHVVHISLYSNNMTGVIPAELGHLTKLQSLELSSTQLSGIPPEIGNLTNLQFLRVYSNQLSEIPPEIGNLTNLQKLWLSSNQLSEIPPEIGNLTNLQVLDLSRNQLSEIPPEIGNLTNLQTLILNSNQLSEIPPEIGNLTNLQSLNLHNNQLSEPIPTELKNLTELNNLTLNNNYLTGDSLDSSLATFLNNLSTLQLHYNCLTPTDSIIINILDHKNIRWWLPSWETIQTNCLPSTTACQLYAVHDDGLNDSQFFTVDLDDLSITALGNRYVGYDIESLAIHPQTDKLYAAAGDTATTGEAGYLYEVNPETGKLTRIGDTQFAEIEDLAFSPDGTLYGWAKGQGLITIDVTSGQGTLMLASPVALGGLTISKQAETTIFYGSANGELWRYAPDMGNLEVLCSGLQGEIEALEMLNTGDLLIGSYATAFGMHLLNPNTCERVMADDSLAHAFNDVEGLAIPIAACQ